jgi:hypothetical protein
MRYNIGIMKPRTLKDLNQYETNSSHLSYYQGFLDAANLAGELYNSSSRHTHDLTDCILAKRNLLKRGSKIRRNPFYRDLKRIYKNLKDYELRKTD